MPGNRKRKKNWGQRNLPLYCLKKYKLVFLNGQRNRSEILLRRTPPSESDMYELQISEEICNSRLWIRTRLYGYQS